MTSDPITWPWEYLKSYRVMELEFDQFLLASYLMVFVIKIVKCIVFLCNKDYC